MKGRKNMKKYCFSDIPEFASDKLINYLINSLDLNTEDIEKMSLGITVMLINIFETTLVFTLAFFLGTIKETLIFFITFAILRALAAGVHCKTSRECLFVTFLFYIGSSLLSKYCPINASLASCIGTICIAVLFKYAPADTENRPILGIHRRKRLRIQTTIFAFTALSVNIFIADITILNLIMYALLIESISTLPITYKLFKVNYNNYKLYE